MDHYDYPQFDNQAAAAELGRMGKRTGILPESLGGRRDLTDLLTQTCWQRPEFTGGDLWCALGCAWGAQLCPRRWLFGRWG